MDGQPRAKVFFGVHIFIAIYLLVQIALPLDYYFFRQDKNDERFTWRMFSSTRGLTCTPRFRVDGKQPNLDSTFHVVWRQLAQRGRQAVVVGMGKKLCRDNPGRKVQVELRCTAIDGKRTEFGGDHDFCDVGTL